MNANDNASARGGRLPDAPPLPPRFGSAGKRWRFRRDTVIYLAHRAGISQRVLADVFDLTRSRVSRIVQTFHRLAAEGRDGQEYSDQ
jgi:hypothetical protein